MGAWGGQLGVGDWVWMVALWVAVLVVVVWAVSRLFPAGRPSTGREQPDRRPATGDADSTTVGTLGAEPDGRAPVSASEER